MHRIAMRNVAFSKRFTVSFCQHSCACTVRSIPTPMYNLSMEHLPNHHCFFDGNVGRVRFSHEFAFADQLASVCFHAGGKLPELPSAERIRRQLLSSHVRLSENMAP